MSIPGFPFSRKLPEADVACRYTRLLCALNLNIHFHMLFLDGVYIDSTGGTRTRFRRVKAPTSDELTQLTHAIARRIAHHLLGSSITYRIAIGPNRDAKYSRCRRCPTAGPTSPDRKRVTLQASRFTPASQRRTMNGPNWNVCAGTSQGRRYPTSACH
jgi:hypothetical protein